MSDGTEDTQTAVEAPRRRDGSAAESVAAGAERSPRGAPTRLGRYLVIDKAGAGAMGVVYAAYDPQLDRRVAIKLLLPGPGPQEAQARLLREAQAMAQLSHPNVVAVHDVGEHAQSVYLAMDFVQGESLRAWLVRERRSWHEVLAMCMQAGRGLAAAHDAGIVHRDFKPDNVLVDDKGRAMVTDFGLARAGATVEKDKAGSPSAPTGETQTVETGRGAIVGTPAYMAPEQFEGGVVGARSNQFAFCIMLWEALFGARPFGGANFVELAVAVRVGVVHEPSRGTNVPRWLRRVVTRGLAVDPAARWPSMDALLAELERGHARARTRTAAIVIGVLAIAAVGTEAWRRTERARAVASCEASGASISEVWPGEGDVTRDSVSKALLATETSYAPTTVAKLQPRLDQWARSWQDARTQTCLDHSVERRWNDDLGARADECLEERRAALAALVAELEHADTTVAQRAILAAANLGRTESCADESTLARRPALPSDLRADVMQIRAELSRAVTLELTGKPAIGLAVAEDALVQAERVAWPPLTAQAQIELGLLLERTGEYERAQQVLQDAYVGAGMAAAPELAERAAIYLVAVVGGRRARFEDGLLWARLAEVEATRLGGVPDELGEAARLNALAIVYWTRGSYSEARGLSERSLAIRERVLGVDHPDVAASLGNLASICRLSGATAEARALSERALAIRENTLGPDHPELALSLGNLANIEAASGAHAKAMELQTRALALREAALGPDHLDVAQSLANLAAIHRALGDSAQAKPLNERALAIREKGLGPDHIDVATSLNNLANTELALGESAAAEAHHARALAIREKALGPDHLDVARSLVGLGKVASADRRPAEAVPLFERALAIFEMHKAPEEDLAEARSGLARAREEVP